MRGYIRERGEAIGWKFISATTPMANAFAI